MAEINLLFVLYMNDGQDNELWEFLVNWPIVPRIGETVAMDLQQGGEGYCVRMLIDEVAYSHYSVVDDEYDDYLSLMKAVRADRELARSAPPEDSSASEGEPNG